MVKLFFRFVVPLGILFVSLLLGYNYFFGNEAEQAQSRAIVNKVADLGRDVFGLLQSEKEKFDGGKYDSAMDKIKQGIASIRSQIDSGASNAAELRSQLNVLESKETEIESMIESMRVNESGGGDVLPRGMAQPSGINQINDQIRSLVGEVERLGQGL